VSAYRNPPPIAEEFDDFVQVTPLSRVRISWIREVVGTTIRRIDGVEMTTTPEFAVRVALAMENWRRRRPGQHVSSLVQGDPLVERQLVCPHCIAGEPSVWDSVMWRYAHPDDAKLKRRDDHADKFKLCRDPWRKRCRRCSANPSACVCASGTSP